MSQAPRDENIRATAAISATLVMLVLNNKGNYILICDLVLVKDDVEEKPETPTLTKEERNLAKMVMPKKDKRLLEKIEYSKRKKTAQVRQTRMKAGIFLVMKFFLVIHKNSSNSLFIHDRTAVRE